MVTMRPVRLRQERTDRRQLLLPPHAALAIARHAARVVVLDAIAVGQRLHDVGDDVGGVRRAGDRLRGVERLDGQHAHPLFDESARTAGRHGQREEVAAALGGPVHALLEAVNHVLRGGRRRQGRAPLPAPATCLVISFRT